MHPHALSCQHMHVGREEQATGGARKACASGASGKLKVQVQAAGFAPNQLLVCPPLPEQTQRHCTFAYKHKDVPVPIQFRMLASVQHACMRAGNARHYPHCHPHLCHGRARACQARATCLCLCLLMCLCLCLPAGQRGHMQRSCTCTRKQAHNTHACKPSARPWHIPTLTCWAVSSCEGLRMTALTASGHSSFASAAACAASAAAAAAASPLRMRAHMC